MPVKQSLCPLPFAHAREATSRIGRSYSEALIIVTGSYTAGVPGSDKLVCLSVAIALQIDLRRGR